MVVRKKQTYFSGKSSSDNVLRTQKCSGIKSVKVWRLQKSLGIPRQFQIIKHNSFLPLLRRAGRRNELVQVDPICNPSGGRDEGLHERTEVMLPSIGHLERHHVTPRIRCARCLPVIRLSCHVICLRVAFFHVIICISSACFSKLASGPFPRCPFRDPTLPHAPVALVRKLFLESSYIGE